MFTRIGLPQLGLIVLILIVFLIYTQRHRFRSELMLTRCL